MFYNSHLERVRGSFADQFDVVDGKIFYRKNLKGAPIEVSASERDTLIRDFNRHLKMSFMATIPATIIVILGLTLLSMKMGLEPSNLVAFGTVAFIVTPPVAGMIWAWNAPARLVAGRAPVGQERTAAEMRRIGFERLTWGRLGAVAAGGVLLALFRVDWRRDLLDGANPYWLLFAAAVLVVCVVQAVRKMRTR